MNGISSGTAGAVGDAACKRVCNGKTCFAANAGAGAACRPNSKSDPCEGQCDGAGHCSNVAQPCEFGRNEQLCTFDLCNFTKATECNSQNLANNTLCSDAMPVRSASATARALASPGPRSAATMATPAPTTRVIPILGLASAPWMTPMVARTATPVPVAIFAVAVRDNLASAPELRRQQCLHHGYLRSEHGLRARGQVLQRQRRLHDR
jgi:hypothetical protein